MSDEMINKYLEKINKIINNRDSLPDYIINELIAIKNMLEDKSISIEDRKLRCVLVDDIIYRINILDETIGIKKRR